MKIYLILCSSAIVLSPPHASPAIPPEPNIAIQWNNAALQGIRDAKMGAPIAARALAIVHTCIYDAWVAYDENAVGTQLRGALPRPTGEQTQANKERAISYAAYRALTDVLSVDTNSVYSPLCFPQGVTMDCPFAVGVSGGSPGTVQVAVPTKVLPIATLFSGVLLCQGGQGWSRIVTNQLQDQFGKPYAHAGIVMQDNLVFGSPNQLGLAPGTGSAPTDANGSWPDSYTDCTTLCPTSGQSAANQTWTYNGIPLPHVNTVVYKCTSITIDGF